MDLAKDYNFYVVEFLDPPSKELDRYVCIPDSWIVMRDAADQIVITKYPVEKPSKTKKRVKKSEPCSDEWSIYVADVKYGTDCHDDAYKYIKVLKKSLIKEGSSSEQAKDDKLPTTKNLPKKQNHTPPSNTRIEKQKTKASEAPVNCDTQSVLEEPPSRQPIIFTYKKQTNEIETAPAPDQIAKQMRSSSETVNDKQLPLTLENPINRNSVIQKNYSGTVQNIDRSKNKGSREITINESYEIHNTPEKTGKSFENQSTIVVEKPTSGSDNSSPIENNRVTFEVDIEILRELHAALIENCKSLDKIVNSLSNFNPLAINNNLRDTSSIDPIAPVEQEKRPREEKERQVEKRKQPQITAAKRKKFVIDIDDDDEEEDNYESYARRKTPTRKFSLPPEYDENNSKWTLKHHERAPGLVELIEHTGIYINAVKLINCKRLAKDAKSLARLLLVEIFTESALSTCSLTGARAKAFDTDGTNIRPGLDEDARTVLLTYVDEYAQDKKWPNTDTTVILNSIRNKMQEMRFKHRRIDLSNILSL